MKTKLTLVFLTVFTYFSFAQWQPTKGLYSGSAYSVIISNNEIITGTDGVIYKSSDNGVTWRRSSNGLPSVITYIRSLVKINNRIVAGTDAGVYYSTDNGDNWISSGLSNTVSVYDIAIKGSDLFIATNQNPVYKSTDDGSTWTALDFSSFPNPDIMTCLTVKGNDLYTAGYGGTVYKSTDNGVNWTQSYSGPPFYVILTMVTAGNDILFGTDGGGIFKTTVGQNSWTAINNGLTNMFVNSLHAYGDTLFAGTQGGGVFRSIDDGANWSDVSNEIPLFSVVTSFTSWDNYVAVATSDNGVYVTPNNGDYWEAINLGLADTSITCMTVSPNYVWAGTNKMGVWKRDKADIVVTATATSHISNLDEEPSIHINPNPIKDIFTIQLPSKFQNKENEVIIYNLMGEIVLQ